MADLITEITHVSNGESLVKTFTNASDGTGGAVTLVDLSALTATKAGKTLIAVDIEKVKGTLRGFNYLTVLWDATTDVRALIIPPGDIDLDFSDIGYMRNTDAAGFTGDVLSTIDVATDGDSFTLTFWFKLRWR